MLRHPALAQALVGGSCNLDQAAVVVEVFDDLDRLGLDEPLLADAQAFLLDQTWALGPRDLRRAGQALVEQLTARPSQDTLRVTRRRCGPSSTRPSTPWHARSGTP